MFDRSARALLEAATTRQRYVSALAELVAGLAIFALFLEGVLLGLAAPVGLRLSAGVVYVGMALLLL